MASLLIAQSSTMSAHQKRPFAGDTHSGGDRLRAGVRGRWLVAAGAGSEAPSHVSRGPHQPVLQLAAGDDGHPTGDAGWHRRAQAAEEGLGCDQPWVQLGRRQRQQQQRCGGSWP